MQWTGNDSRGRPASSTETPTITLHRVRHEISFPSGVIVRTSGSDPIEALSRLIERQAETLPRAIKELAKHGEKRSHWSWWAFPACKVGQGDPDGTYVTKDTAQLLLRSQATAIWRLALELTAMAAEAFGTQAIPEEDWGRMEHFIRLWRTIPAKSKWLEEVVGRLSQLPWNRGTSARGDLVSGRRGTGELGHSSWQ